MQRLSHLRSPPCYRPLIRASNTKYHIPFSIITTPPPSRLLSQCPALPHPPQAPHPAPPTPRRSLTYPRKDDQAKDSINREATEYSKSGTDDASAMQEDTAFDPSVTEPTEQKDKVGSKTGVRFSFSFVVVIYIFCCCFIAVMIGGL